jgi:hypothetical protein
MEEHIVDDMLVLKRLLYKIVVVDWTEMGDFGRFYQWVL